GRCVQIRSGGREDLGRAIGAIAASGAALAGVVDLWALDAPAGDAAEELAATESACLGAARALAEIGARRWEEPPRLWLVTRGARAVLPGESPAFAQAALWGLGRSAMLEHPAQRCTLVDLDPGGSGDRAEARRLLDELLAPPETPIEQAIALR